MTYIFYNTVFIDLNIIIFPAPNRKGSVSGTALSLCQLGIPSSIQCLLKHWPPANIAANCIIKCNAEIET